MVSTQKNFCAFSSASLCAVGLLCFRKSTQKCQKDANLLFLASKSHSLPQNVQSLWEQDTVLTSKSNTLRYKKENRKKFSAAAAIQKKIPLPYPHPQNCSMVKNTNSLRIPTTIFSIKKKTKTKTYSAFLA